MDQGARQAVAAEAARLSAHFAAAGAVPVEADILQPADLLLDLYGEDIRARAYVTRDPVQGEMMLRPDFTVPVVRMHMADGAEPARYSYAGPVFRKQEAGAGRASEYLQVGYEIFDRADPAAADAEVFAQVAAALAGLPVRPATGDIGLLRAAVAGLSTTERRRKALMRHLWRPARFRALLERFAGRTPPAPERLALIAAARAQGAAALMADAGPEIGLRGADEVVARIEALVEDAEAPPIPAAECDAIEALLALTDTAPRALARLEGLAAALPALAPAVARMAARLAALAARGVDVAALPFEGSFGRTTLEYYDGFVFGFSGPGGGPALASGGRYDALTRHLGGGREIPAVGAVIRPALVVALGEAGR